MYAHLPVPLGGLFRSGYGSGPTTSVGQRRSVYPEVRIVVVSFKNDRKNV
jgi:hypothetical protein